MIIQGCDRAIPSKSATHHSRSLLLYCYTFSMETVYFVTSNPGKVESLRNILASANIEIPIDMLSAEYPEDKSTNSLEKIAEEGAQFCAEKYSKRVIVTDTGIFITALGGYPGINTAVEIKRIGVEGILEQLQAKEDRSVEWRLALAYGAPDEPAQLFTAALKGIIADSPRGENGFGFDTIFIPEGTQTTLAEPDPKTFRDNLTPFRQAVLDFGRWYAKKVAQ